MKQKRFFSLLFIALSVLLGMLAGCGGPAPQPEGPAATAEAQAPAEAAPTPPAGEQAPAYFPGDEWQATVPEQVGMDSARLAEMLAFIQEKGIRMHSILVVRHGQMALEAYFNPYGRETPHQIASITKSVVGALVGIAIEEGKIKSVRQPVTDFFPGRQIANLDERKQAMTLEDLLTLSPGFDCSDVQGTEAEMSQSEDWVQFVLDLPMKSAPGTKWTYCSSAAHLASAILQQATGLDARTYANERLFAPLGIAPVPPERWPSDPGGVSTGGNGLFLTPAEVARFAYLYLHQGRWGSTQVVPQAWVEASTQPHIEVGRMKEYGDMDRSYGYLWSIYPQEKFYAALGRNGQHIHVFPEQDMVVVFTSATPVVSDEKQFLLLKDYILDAVRSEGPLAENPQGAETLKAALADAAQPVRPVAAIPETWQQISGKTIRWEENPAGWTTMGLTFEARQEVAKLLFNNELEISVGLDNLYRVQDVPGLGKAAFRGSWDGEDKFLIEERILGTWFELELSLTLKEGGQVALFQRDVVDGGSLFRVSGKIEAD